MKKKENNSSALPNNFKKKIALHNKLMFLLIVIGYVFVRIFSYVYLMPSYITFAAGLSIMMLGTYILTRVLFRSEHQMISIGNSKSLIVKHYKYSGKRRQNSIRSATANNAYSTDEVPYDKSFEEHLYNDPNKK
ncbi:MAG: hypothetical protein ACYCSG_07235 [Thermoplasmataceae archaeon]